MEDPGLGALDENDPHDLAERAVAKIKAEMLEARDAGALTEAEVQVYRERAKAAAGAFWTPGGSIEDGFEWQAARVTGSAAHDEEDDAPS